jgi:flagellar basal-body rod modification protein FlgD
MTSPINSTSQLSSASNTAATAAAGASQPTLGKDDFLKLLMAQLQNQDPLQPTDGTQFVTQLAQFNQVEQSVNQSSALGTIATQLQGLSNANASNLVGKTVTVQGGGMNWDGTFAATANVTLAGPAAQVTVSIKDSQGNVVRTMKLGAEAAGPITWNGADNSGQPTPAGSYSVGVAATDANGQSVNVSQSVTGVVTKVSFDQGYPALTLNSGAVAPVSQLVSVGTTPATP